MSHRVRVNRSVKISVALAVDEVPDMTMRFGKMVFAPRHLAIDWFAATEGDWRRSRLIASGPQRLKSGGLSDKNTATCAWWDHDSIPEWAAAILAVNRPNPIDPDELPPQASPSEVQPIDLDGA